MNQLECTYCKENELASTTFTFDKDKNSLICTKCGTEYHQRNLEKENESLKAQLIALQNAANLLIKSVEEAEKRLTSSDEQREHFKRQIYCSLINKGSDHPVHQTEMYLKKYYGEVE